MTFSGNKLVTYSSVGKRTKLIKDMRKQEPGITSPSYFWRKGTRRGLMLGTWLGWSAANLRPFLQICIRIIVHVLGHLLDNLNNTLHSLVVLSTKCFNSYEIKNYRY